MQRLDKFKLGRLILAGWMLIVLVNSIYGYHHPILNWDIFPYTGLAIEANEGSRVSLRQAALDDLEQAYGKEAVSAMNAGNSYTQAVAVDDGAYAAQLPFYRVKPLYISLIGLVGKMLGSYSRAAILICSVCFMGIGLALWQIRPRGFPAILWCVMLLFLLFNPWARIYWYARAATPDPLAMLFFFGRFLFSVS